MKAIISLLIICFCLALLPLPALGDLKISKLPRFSVEDTARSITPLAQYLAEQTGLEITPLIIATFAQYQEQIQSGIIDIAFTNPLIYVLVSDTHEVIARPDIGEGGTRFRGIIITRSDSPLRTLNDLKGKRVAFVGKGGAGGFLSQKLTLMEAGIDVDQDLELVEVADNKHENVIFAVHIGNVDAGFIRESSFNKIDNFIPSSSLRVLAHTTWFPTWALSVNRSLPEDVKRKITEAVLALPADSKVARALRISRFVPAKDSDYNVIRRAIGIDQVDIINY